MNDDMRVASARLLLLVVVTLLLPHVVSSTWAQFRAELYVAGLTSAVGFAQDPSWSDMQFVVEQGGRIRVIRSGVLLADDFLDLSGRISSGGERGLLGLVFPADYASSGRFYVNFTNPAGHNIVSRFKRSTTDPLVADAGSRFDLRWPSGNRFIEQPFANHNGGHLAFGPDGYLYIGMGYGGSANDPNHFAQDPYSLLGKMLRIDVAVADDNPNGYRIPPGNFFSPGSPLPALAEIWSFGLRNPWQFSAAQIYPRVAVPV